MATLFDGEVNALQPRASSVAAAVIERRNAMMERSKLERIEMYKQRARAGERMKGGGNSNRARGLLLPVV